MFYNMLLFRQVCCYGESVCVGYIKEKENCYQFSLEVPGGFEPPYTVLQTVA